MNSSIRHRYRLTITGFVQGVGFRPFVFTLATAHQLSGFVFNHSRGVTIEVEGNQLALTNFIKQLHSRKPPLVRYFSIHKQTLPLQHNVDFVIKRSQTDGESTAYILPDIATCSQCVSELFDATNRRAQYPFTTCTHCGPRFSIMTGLPYDRPLTTMNEFPLCLPCMNEYQNPTDRRFHAQPIACASCGPSLQLIDPTTRVIDKTDVIAQTVKLLHQGFIIGVKGLGGYQLVVDATNEAAVHRLRERKSRPAKPFAVMFPSIKEIQASAYLKPVHQHLLASPEAPIVIMKKRPKTNLAPSLAPDNPYLGVMVPYTPLHHLICRAFGKPIVCTSGNLSGDPIIIDDNDAIQKLRPICDYFLIHNRPIHQHVDDSVVTVIKNKPFLIRRARGYTPVPLWTSTPLFPLLAVGSQQKNTIALSRDRTIFVSQYIGDLDSIASFERFKSVIDHYQYVLGVKPKAVACDAHPGYESTIYATSTGLPVVPVYHHEAHVAACLADNQHQGEALGIAWDGTGLGRDGTIWGSEFFHVVNHQFNRIASLKPFLLIGGDQAVAEPKRIGLALLFELLGEDCFTHPWTTNVFTDKELMVYQKLVRLSAHALKTSSMGRLFDGIAALLNIKHTVSFEGQAAMMLEHCVTTYPHQIYPFRVNEKEVLEIDWRPLVAALLEDYQQQVNRGLIAGKFHRTVSEMIIAIAQNISVETVALSGGCFQNRVLTQGTIEALHAHKFRSLVHRELPPNDGNLSVGQIIIANTSLER